MKTREIKEYIKKEANKIEIKDYRENILSKVNYVETKKEITSKRKLNLKLIYTSFALVASCFVIFFAFLMNQNNKDSITRISKAKEILSYEVIALSNVVDTSNEATVKRLSNAVNTQIAEEINDYLTTGEMMLNKSNISIKYSLNEDKGYDYENKLVVTYTDKSNYNYSYVLYFNEQKKVESDDDIDEVSSSIKGILIKDNQSFRIEGEKEVEEDEYETTLIIYYSDSNYIKITQETEINENEYTYEFYENNIKIKELSLEIKEENNLKEMSIEVNENGVEKEFSFEYKNDNTIECSYETNEIEEEIIIEIFKEYYLYKFENGEIRINR